MLLSNPVEEKNQKLPSGPEINLIGACGPEEMRDIPVESLNEIKPLNIGMPAEKISNVPPLYHTFPSGPWARCQRLSEGSSPRDLSVSAPSGVNLIWKYSVFKVDSY
jgi:hypothetical protein